MMLFFQLLFNNMNAYPMVFPIVPKGKGRIRLIFHAHNTLEQVDRLVEKICDWAEEMLDIQNGELPSATRKAYAIQKATQ